MTQEQNYAKRELDEKFGDIKDSLDRIEQQTVKTNGSVAKAFVEINALKNWRWFIAGIGSVITVLLIPILIALIERGTI